MSNNIINPDQTFRDSTGAVRAFGLLTVYENNTTTKATVYSDTDLSVAQSNPYTLDAYGRVVGDLTWAGLKTIVVTNEDGSDPFTRNDVTTTTAALGDWSASVTATYVSDYVFTLAGDQTADFTVNRRVKLTGGADRYGTISSSVYTSLTTVTLRNVTDNTPAVAVLNSGNNTAAVSIISNTLTPLPYGGAWPIYEQIDITGVATITEDIVIMPGANLNISAATTLSGDILIHPGGVLTHGAAVTCSATVTCLGLNSFAGAGALTLSGQFTAPKGTQFTGAGAVTISAKQKALYPEWWGAGGDGVANDTTAVQSCLTNSANQTVMLSGSYLIDTALVGESNSIIKSSADGAEIITATADISLLTYTSKTDFEVRDILFTNVVSTSYAYNILVNGGNNGRIINTEHVGCSGDGIRVTGGASRIDIIDNYFHDFTDGSIQDSSDINLYNSATFCTVRGNRCFGGNWHGIKSQLTSTDHKIVDNWIGAHTAYGIICYDTTPRDINTVISGNEITDIAGSVLISGTARAGAGIYCVSVGGVTIANNYLARCNVSTAVETLTPGAIGLSGAFSPCKIIGNTIEATSWYGIAVFTSTENVLVANNTINDGTLVQIYVKNSDNVSIANNILSWTSAVQGIFANDDSVTSNNISITGNTLIGNGVAAQTGIAIKDIDGFVCNGNYIYNTITRGIQSNSSDNGSINSNTVITGGAGEALQISSSTAVTCDGNHLVSTGTYGLVSSGTCTNSYVRGGYLSPTVQNNAGTGCNYESRRSSALASGNAQVGDKIWNTAPSVDGNSMVISHWVCTVAGSPGTWTTQYVSSVSPAT